MSNILKPDVVKTDIQTTELSNPYGPFLDTIEKPARYIGGEKYIQRKPWDIKKAKIALCFPDVYEIGMSHLGYKILYDELNKYEEIIAERSYCPWIDMEAVMRTEKVPLVTLENYRPLNEFDIVGFSLQYEMSFTNILNMLELGNIPVWQKDRKENDPFVISGGPCATHPEPIAPFMDFVVIGDGEDLFARIAVFIKEEREKKTSRNEILEKLAHMQGVYVPSLYNTEVDEKTGFEVVSTPKVPTIPEKVERFFVQSLLDYPIPTKSPIPHMTAIFDRYSVELSRGCTEGCRFCQAGMIYRPVRERRPTDVVKSVMAGLKQGGFEEASLTCLSTADYTAITPLLLELIEKMKNENATLGISSLRAYGLDNRILDKLAEVKNTSLTFAPEAGTDRMRKVINKNISESDMLQTAEDVFSRGWQKMKLYFMIGLPTEEDEDVEGIMEIARKSKLIARQVGAKNPMITVSASSFVPKPHTPFQWASMITYDEIERKQSMLFDLSKRYKIQFRKHVSKISFLEGIVARGDRPIAQLIFNAWKKGARFDGWNETFNFDLWKECLEELKIDANMYLGTIRMDGRLPWDHISVGLEDKFLEREWKKALKNRISPPCGKPAGAIVHHSNLESLEKTHLEEKKKLVCYHCGVTCDLNGMIEERVDFLKSMDAIKDEPYVRPENSSTSILDRREKRGQVIGHKYRLEFTKMGPISYISHLDMQKIVARIFKRSNIEVLLSEGYNQRPLFSFGPALSLGINSLSEFFDVRVPHSLENLAKVLTDLNENTETGIFFKSIKEIEKKDPSIQELSTHFDYFIPVLDEKCVQKEIDEIMAKEAIEIKSYSKKKRAYVVKDARAQIASMKQDIAKIDPYYKSLIQEITGNKIENGINLRTKIVKGGSVRPRELTQILIDNGVNAGMPIKVGTDLSETVSS